MSETAIGVLRRTKKSGGYGRKLAQALGAYEMTSGFHPKQRLAHGGLLVNYGQSKWPIWHRADIRWVNPPDTVRLQADKLECFRCLRRAGVPTVDYTTSHQNAYNWLRQGRRVVARYLLRASKGQGLELFDNVEQFQHSSVAPLYTLEFPKTHEFRITVGMDAEGNPTVLDYVQKKRMGKAKREKHGVDAVNEFQRNYAQGWVFCHQDILEVPEAVSIALASCEAVRCARHAAFTAVDMLYNEQTGEAVVCEMNSAPSLDGEMKFGELVSWLKSLA